MNVIARTLLTEPTRRPLVWDDVLALADAGAFPGDAQLELIDGELIEMPPEGSLNAELRIRLSRALGRLLGDAPVMVAPNGPLHLAPSEVPYPDIYLYDSQLRHDQVSGDAVLLVIEVAASNLAFDLKRKAELYASHGVRDYWVIDVAAQRTHVHHRLDTGRYAVSLVSFDEALVARFAPIPPLKLSSLL